MATKATLIVTAISFVASAANAEIGNRTFACKPLEVYELTVEGLRLASPEVHRERTVGREFNFEEATGWKREPESNKSSQYRVLNPENLIGSPVVAQYGDLNPTFLKFMLSNEDDPRQFLYFQFGGGMNVFGTCVVLP